MNYLPPQIMPKNSMLSPKRKSGLCSKNPQIEEEQSVDCLNYNGEMLPGTTSSILSGMIESNSMFPLLTVPWCMVQGGLDKLVDVENILKLYIFYSLVSLIVQEIQSVCHRQKIRLFYSTMTAGTTFGMKKKLLMPFLSQ